MLEIGTKAPEFTLPDKDGNAVSLTDFAGKKVVLYFYSKDNTPGCTRQACAFAGAYQEFKKINAVVIGISKDSVASHQKFAGRYSLPSPPRIDRHPSLRCVAGEKALWQGEHGGGAIHLCD